MTHSPLPYLAELDDHARRVYRQMISAGYNGNEARQVAQDDYRIRRKYGVKVQTSKEGSDNGARAGKETTAKKV